MSDPVVPPAQLERESALRGQADLLAGSHFDREDCWYSCPLSEEGCCNEAAGNECNCGRDARAERIFQALKAAAPVVPAERPNPPSFAWKCLDCNAWTLNVGQGQNECGNCHTIKPFGASLVTCEFQPAAASAADRVSALTSQVVEWQQLVTDILVRVQNGQSQSIGSIDSHRAPQIGVDEIKRWWTEVERLVVAALLDPAERPAPDPKM